MNEKSNLDRLGAWGYLALPLNKSAGHLIPVRFMLFAMIGGLGVVTHLAALWLAVYPLGVGFPAGQAIATLIAMTGNFCLNNLLTFSDKRLRGGALITGLLSFYAVCSIGAAANVGIASHLFDANCSWWLAGLGGAATGAVWNYAMSSVFIWRSRTAPHARPRLCTTASIGANPAALTYTHD
jgi:dolichol-phosphate mannosyltransferase